MRLEVKRSNSIGGRLVTALRKHLPGAFLTPEKKELVALLKDMAKAKPPKGSDESWKELTGELVEAAEEAER